ncbi:MAG TPA: ACT domain-containing protein [Nitrososphaerales archaeon]
MGKERLIIITLGLDRVGIVSGISSTLANHNANIIELTSSEIGGSFVMIMLVDISTSDTSINELQRILVNKGKKIGVQVTVQHEDVFRSMHRI